MKLIETINTAAQTAVAPLNKLNLGNIDKSVCQCAYEYNGMDTITIKQNGYYLVLFKVDATSTAATQQIQVSATGNGSTSNVEATAYAATSGLTQTLSFFKIMKVCGTQLAVSFINSSDAAATFSNLVVSVVKIA